MIAHDGEFALELAQRFHPSLAVIDIRMPKLDGLEVIRRIRTDHGLEGMRILSLSGMVEDGTAEECLEAGADDHLRKPFSLDEIQGRLTGVQAL